jgi:alkyl hydroperoxide reductase subunit AhpC
VGISCDTTFTQKAWADYIGGISYPLLSDFWPHGAVAQKYGVLRPQGLAERAIFIIDKQGVIRYIDVHELREQPDEEVLFRELASLR